MISDINMVSNADKMKEEAWRTFGTKIYNNDLREKKIKFGFYERNKYCIYFMNFLGILPIYRDSYGKVHSIWLLFHTGYEISISR